MRLESSTKKMKIDKILIYIALLWAVLALPGTLNAQKAMGDDASGHSHTGHPKNKVVAPSYAWKLIQPLGLREEATIDTLFTN